MSSKRSLIPLPALLGACLFSAAQAGPVPPMAPKPIAKHIYLATPDKKRQEAFYSLQGMVNRIQPRIFMMDDEQDSFWTQIMRSGYGIQLTQLKDPYDLFRMFAPEIGKMVVFDYKDCDAAVNVATTVAGVTGSIMVKSEDMAFFRDTIGLAIEKDLRGLWKTNTDAYQWAFDNYRSRCSDSLLGSIANSTRHEIRDYLIQQKAFVFTVNSENTSDITSDTSLQRKILASYPPYTPIFGFWTEEVKDVNFVSVNGHYMQPSDNTGDLSILSGMEPWDRLRMKRSTRIPAYNPANTYVFFTFSQGPGLRYQREHLIGQWLKKDSTGRYQRDLYPLGFMMNNIAAPAVQPMVEKYFYDGMDENQYFFGAAEGAGYSSVEVLKGQGLLDQYLANSRAALKRMDLDVSFLKDPLIALQNDSGYFKKYVKVVKPRAILYKQAFPKDNITAKPFLVDSVPVFQNAVKFKSGTTGSVHDLIKSIEDLAKTTDFMWVFMDHVATIDDYIQASQTLKLTHPEIVILPPGEFFNLYESVYLPKPLASRARISPANDLRLEVVRNRGGSGPLVRIHAMASGHYDLRIHSLQGRLLRQFHGELQAGAKVWEGSILLNGIGEGTYLFRLAGEGEGLSSGKIAILP